MYVRDLLVPVRLVHLRGQESLLPVCAEAVVEHRVDVADDARLLRLLDRALELLDGAAAFLLASNSEGTGREGDALFGGTAAFLLKLAEIPCHRRQL